MAENFGCHAASKIGIWKFAPSSLEVFQLRKSVVSVDLQARIYLDNAATSWPKCAAALEAAWQFVTECGATAGRGAYGSSQVADRWVADARRQIGKLIGAQDPQRIALCNSGTHALNAALWGILRSGDHVITSEIEHNSVLRPLEAIRHQLGTELDVAVCDAQGVVQVEHARSLVRNNTRLIAIGHASNVSGAVQDLSDWSNFAKSIGALLLVDGSQSIGYLPVDVSRLGIDLFAAAGHKGLRAMPGTGFLYCCPALQSTLRSLMQGGTGVRSESLDDVAAWPSSVEVGNLNVPGVISMAVAAKLLNDDVSPDGPAWQREWRPAFERLVAGLSQIDGVDFVGLDTHSTSSVARIPLASIAIKGIGPHEAAAILDENYGIEVRAGLHCAALVHQRLGSSEGGTLRFSPGHATTLSQIDRVIAAVREIATQVS